MIVSILLVLSSACRYAGSASTAIWPRRRTVSSGSFTNNDAHDVQNLTTENVIGDRSRSIRNCERRTSGVVRVMNGWTREFSIVGAMSVGWQIHEGRDRRAASVRLGARVVGVTINRVRIRSRGASIRPVATAAVAATHNEAHG